METCKNKCSLVTKTGWSTDHKLSTNLENFSVNSKNNHLGVVSCKQCGKTFKYHAAYGSENFKPVA